MQPHDIENRVDQILKTIEEGGNVNVEDDHIELKRQWPADPAKAARRIAGQANAADGRPILWLIGIDEQDGVHKVESPDPADWWQSVEACFTKETKLHMQSQVIHRDKGTVVALVFETTAAPFLVRHGDKNEVPWREGTRVRSATRSDILRIMSVKPPTIEVLEVSLAARTNQSGHALWRFKARTHIITPGGQGKVTIPSTGSLVNIKGRRGGPDQLTEVTFDIRGAEQPDQVKIDGAEHVLVTALGPRTIHDEAPFVRITLTLQPAGGYHDAEVITHLQKTSQPQSNELYRYEGPIDL